MLDWVRLRSQVHHRFTDEPRANYLPCASLVSLIGLSAIAAETNEDEGPLPKRLKLEGDHPQPPSLLTGFHRRYWGHPLESAFTTLPTPTALDGLESSGDVLPGDPFLDGLDVRFLVRAEYIRVFDRVKAVYDESHANHLAVVTGQPGIGATPSAICSALLIVALCVQEKLIGFNTHCDVVLERSSPSSGTARENVIYSRTP